MAERLRQVVWTVRGNFKFIFYREDGHLVAHCLDTDTMATGDTPAEAIKNLQTSIEMEIETAAKKGDFSALWDAAPGQYTAMIAKGVPLLQAYHEAKYIGFQKVSENEAVDKGLDTISTKLNEALHTQAN